MGKEDKPMLMLMGGASGSGKTTIAELVISRVSPYISSVMIKMDDYYPNNDALSFEDRCKINYDDPGIFDYELLYSNLSDLMHGREITKPVYCFEQHNRKKESVHVGPCQFIMLEGIYALYDARIRDLATIKFYVDTPLEECMARRIERDCKERGRNVAEVIWRLRNHVLPMYEEHVIKTRKKSNFNIDWNDDKERVINGLVGIVQNYCRSRSSATW